MFQTTPKTMPRFENSTTQRPGLRAARRASGPSGPGPLAMSAALSLWPARSPMPAPCPARTTRATMAMSIQPVLHVQKCWVM
jgi:hypothetical protein